MAVASLSPAIVPYGADQTVYVVIDRSGALGSVYREVERTDLETVVDDLIAGLFSDPVQVIAFNTLEHWAHDLSSDVAKEIEARCDIEGIPIPEHVRDFVERRSVPQRESATLI